MIFGRGPYKCYKNIKIQNYALKLYDVGFNVIPVSEKRPLTSWNPSKRIDRNELEKLLEKASGIAVCGGPENPSKPVSHLIIIDIDNPEVLEKTFFLRGAVEKTVRWYSGVRCPRCLNKHVDVLEHGKLFKCPKCNTEFTIDQAKRGVNALFWVSVDTYEKYLRGTLRAGAVEILVNNYALIPPSIHPSGIKYEWIKPIDFNLSNYGIYALTDTELVNILEELGLKPSIPIETPEEVEVVVSETLTEKAERKIVEEGCKELDDHQVSSIIEELRPIYVKGVRDLIVYALTGELRLKNVCYESARQVIEQLAVNDNEFDQRIYVLDRTYGRRGNPPKVIEGLNGLLEKKKIEHFLEFTNVDTLTTIIQNVKRILSKKGYVRKVIEVDGFKIPILRKKLIESKNKALIARVFAEYFVNQFNVKTFIVNDSVLGIYCWDSKRYFECEELAQKYLRETHRANKLAERIKLDATRLLKEYMFQVEKANPYRLRYERLAISFENLVLDWEALLSNDYENAFRPHDPNFVVFHHINYNLNRDIVIEALTSDIEKVAEKYCPKTLKAFKDWVGEKWILLFEIIGYTLFPRYDLHKAIMLVGEGSNGKSTYLRLIRKILGSENITSVSLQEIMNDRFAPINLYRKLANIYADLPKDPLRRTGIFKILTGEDVITADRKYRDRITFLNYAKMVFSANELPEVDDMTEAFWRRWIVIEFPNRFPPDPEFFEKTFTPREIEAVIAISIAAFKKAWERRQFSFEGSTADYREVWLRKTNSVYAFIRESIENGKLVEDPSGYVETGELYQAYIEYCNENERDPVEKRKFTIELERLGYKRVAIHGKRYYKGLELVEQSLTGWSYQD